MPGCGKSRYAKMFAERYHLAHIDLDSYIEKDAGKSISEIFETEKESGFRQLEEQILREICDVTTAPTIISCGGGTPCFFDNINFMNGNGITIYIRCETELLLKNLSKISLKPRPLLEEMDNVILKKNIENMFFTRKIHYEKARYTLDNVDNSDDLLLQIYNIVKNDIVL